MDGTGCGGFFRSIRAKGERKMEDLRFFFVFFWHGTDFRVEEEEESGLRLLLCWIFDFFNSKDAHPAPVPIL